MTPRDPLLDEVGRALREGDPLTDPRWDALTAGTLSPDEERALRARIECGEAPAATWEALRPLDAAERSSLLDSLFADEAQAAPAPPSPSPSPVGAPDRAGGTVIPISWRRRMRVPGTLLGVAAAASLAGVILLRPAQPEVGALVHHQLLLGVDGDEARGAGQLDGVLPLPPGRSLSARLEAAPDPAAGSAAGRPVEVRVFAVEAGAVRPLVTVQAMTGAPIVLAPIPRSALSTSAVGDVRVVFALGPAVDLADAQALRERVVQDRGRGNIQVISRVVRLVPR